MYYLSVFLRVKILEQFVETVNQLKGQRQQTVQTHVCAALCSLLKVTHQDLWCVWRPNAEQLHVLMQRHEFSSAFQCNALVAKAYQY